MSNVRILEMLDRAHQGPICTSKEWSTRVIPKTVAAKIKEHGLTGACDRENPVNQDDALADKFFRAGFELALEMGFLCLETERIIRATEDEIRDAMRTGPDELILGTGRDRVVFRHRALEDPFPPVVCASLGIVISEELWVPLMTAIVNQKEIDVFEGGSLRTVLGHPVLGGTPYETLVGRYEVELKKQVLWRAGRPGMATDDIISSTGVFGQMGGFGVTDGLDPARSIAIILLPDEMCTNYASFHKIIQATSSGSVKRLGFQSMIGGYSGPAEGVVLTQIAGFLLQFVVHQADFASINAMDVRYSGNCGRDAMWALNMMSQALGRNTHLLKNFVPNQVAGPCTEMLLYESAVAMVTMAASGAEFTIQPRSGGGRFENHLTPLECKFCGEVFKAAAGMTRQQANDIAKVLIPKYEDQHPNPPKGKSVQECYDLKTWQPIPEWRDMYLKVKGELVDLGVPLS